MRKRTSTYRKGNRKIWIVNNKEKLQKYAKNHRNHDISEKEWIACKTYFNNSCAYCGMTNEEHKQLHNQQLHKEHIDSEGANDLSNCVPSCKNCNSLKSISALTDWYNEDNERFSVERLDKINKWLESDYKNFINK